MWFSGWISKTSGSLLLLHLPFSYSCVPSPHLFHFCLVSGSPLRFSYHCRHLGMGLVTLGFGGARSDVCAKVVCPAGSGPRVKGPHCPLLCWSSVGADGELGACCFWSSQMGQAEFLGCQSDCCVRAPWHVSPRDTQPRPEHQRASGDRRAPRKGRWFRQWHLALTFATSLCLTGMTLGALFLRIGMAAGPENCGQFWGVGQQTFRFWGTGGDLTRLLELAS